MRHNPTILIADDEPRFCESLKFLLGSQGYQIRTTTSGLEAQDLLSSHQFDLALLDLVIPDMDGHQLMEHINHHHPETLVIIITGNASLDSAVRALKNGAYDYLRKPFEYEELLTTVQNALTQKRLKSEKDVINGKLEVSEDRYRYLVQNSPDIIYTLDRNGNFTFVSDAADRILGFQNEHLIGNHYTSVIYDDDLERSKWLFNERRTGARATSGVELRLKCMKKIEETESREKKPVTVELKCTGMYDKSPTDGPRRYLGTHGVARDITRRKRLEAQLQQAQKMEALGTLAGGIAHDFNNLLMVMQGHASLMLLKTTSSNPHYQRLTSILECIQSAAALTSQLLGFAREGKYDVKPTDLNAVISKTSRMFGRTKKEIVISEEYEKDIWPVEADQGQIEQVLLNLYVNALQAMPAGGELHLETQNVTFGASPSRPFGLEPGNYVRISVSDNGLGMDEKTQQRIFEPFFTTKEMGRGTGLGLASAYGIIKNHKGAINVESKPGVGTTFCIYLPASERQVEDDRDWAKGLVKGAETVLLVDDEGKIVEVGRGILEALGYTVWSSESGEQAVDFYQANQNTIDIVVLDMVMPGMGGGETYDALKTINPEVKVLLASGYSAAGQAAEILRRGCNGFIQKPFDMNILSERIRDILDGRACPGAVPQ
jgi:two-component system, cell cycle sensor histidine kinase and response regulator CckA